MNRSIRSIIVGAAILAALCATVRSSDLITDSELPQLALLKHEDAGVRAHAAQELGELGPAAREAIQPLIELLDDGTVVGQVAGMWSISVSAVASQALVDIGSESIEPLTRMLEDPSLERRSAGVRVLKDMGPKAAPALPWLAVLAESDDAALRRAAVVAICRIDNQGDTAVPVICRKVPEHDLDLPDEVFNGLTAYLRHNRTIVPFLLQLLEHSDPGTRGRAAVALGKIHEMPQITIPALQKLRSDSAVYMTGGGCVYYEVSVASQAIQALGAFPDWGDELAPWLFAMFEDESSEERMSACRALADLAPHTRKILPRIVQRLEQPDLDRDEAIALMALLGSLGPDAKRAVPVIQKLAARWGENEHGSANADCALVLIDFNGNQTAWRRILHRIELSIVTPKPGTVSPLLAVCIDETIKRLGHKAEAAVPLIAQRLQRLGGDLGALECLGQIGPVAVSATPAIVRNSGYYVTWHVEALHRIGTGTIPYLQQCLESRSAKDPERICAIKALGGFQKLAVCAVPQLTQMARDPHPEIAAASLRALGQIGAVPEVAVPELLAAISDDSVAVREQAALALGSFPEAADQSVPALIKALDDEYIDVRSAAARSLGRLGPLAVRSRADLERLERKDPSFLVQAVARAALRRIK